MNDFEYYNGMWNAVTEILGVRVTWGIVPCVGDEGTRPVCGIPSSGKIAVSERETRNKSYK